MKVFITVINGDDTVTTDVKVADTKLTPWDVKTLVVNAVQQIGKQDATS
jgi:hypothetical protein